jgi:hypothetical protein
MIAGRADGKELVLAQRGDEFFASGADCTHYGGPVAEGLIVGDPLSRLPSIFFESIWIFPGKLRWRQVVQRTVRTLFVVVLPPSFDLSSRIA